MENHTLIGVEARGMQRQPQYMQLALLILSYGTLRGREYNVDVAMLNESSVS
jgi:hypothetical protein